jgi:hypothetical protein
MEGNNKDYSICHILTARGVLALHAFLRGCSHLGAAHVTGAATSHVRAPDHDSHQPVFFFISVTCLIEYLFQITYHFFHWKKGTPFADDQGMYNTLTWWEQMDNGKQLTRNRKFLTAVPVVL